MVRIGWLFLFIFSVSAVEYAEYDLLSRKLEKYPKALQQRRGLPVLDSADQVGISLQLNPKSLTEVNDADFSFSVLAELEIRWQDPYLEWQNDFNASYSYIKSVSIGSSEAWTPDVLHMNNVRELEVVSEFGMKSDLFVNPSGIVTWKPTGIYTSRCDLVINFLPPPKNEKFKT